MLDNCYALFFLLSYFFHLWLCFEAAVDISVVLWMFLDAYLQGLPVNDAL